MAKQASRNAPGGRPRAPVVAPSSDGGNYFKQVWDELKKVIWPTRGELSRMTGVVVATVILFAILIGVADYVLAYGVSKVYTSPAATSTAAPSSAASSAPSPRATPKR